MNCQQLTRRILIWPLIVTLLLSLPGPLTATPHVIPPQPPPHEIQTIPSPTDSTDLPRRMWIVLADPPLIAHRNAGLTDEESYRRQLETRQQTVAQAAEKLGAPVLARLQSLVNALAVLATPEQARRLQTLPGVVTVYPVQDAQMALGESVPWIGAAAVQQSGYTGTGVKIAVIDSGIDYTHAAFQGPGTTEAYTLAAQSPANTVITDTYHGLRLFPTAKVAGGYDFIGSRWPSGRPNPDPDPLDDGPQAGHGTHVAGIAAGVKVTAALTATLVYPGVAPEATLYAYKVCSSIASSCEGIAIVQALERAVVSDTVDVINLSIENPYGGAYEDYVTTLAAENAAAAGVLIAAAAGNSGDHPYNVAAPSVARGVLSVADAFASGQWAPILRITAPLSVAGDYEGAFFHWAPRPTITVTAPLTALESACDSASLPSLKGYIALLPRSGCSAALQVANSQTHGALAVVIYNTALNGPPFTEPADSGVTTPITIPVLTLSTQTGNLLSRTALSHTVTGRLAPNLQLNLADTIAANGSRGPRIWDNALKPDLTAPGANIQAAAVGTGNQAVGRSGSSMAAPHVAGALALLRQHYPTHSALQLYAMLMNTALPNLTLQGFNGRRAPISRQGAGRLQIDKAIETLTYAWSLDPQDEGRASLSYGYQVVTQSATLTKTVQISNRSLLTRTYDLTFKNIYPDDENHGIAVTLLPEQITVTGKSSTTFQVIVTLNAAQLKPWTLSGGDNSGDGMALTDIEFDGMVKIEDTDREEAATLPLHLIPRPGSQIVASPDPLPIPFYGTSRTLTLTNQSAIPGQVEFYALTGEDAAETTRGNLDLTQTGLRLLQLPDMGLMLDFAIVTRESRTHPTPDQFYLRLDTDGDFQQDYYAFNGDLYPSTGQNIVYLCKIGDNYCVAYFFTNTDLNSRTRSFLIPATVLFTDTTHMALNFAVEAPEPFNSGQTADRAPNTGWYTLDAAHLLYNPTPSSLTLTDPITTITITNQDNLTQLDTHQKGILILYPDQPSSRQVQTVTFGINYRYLLPIIQQSAPPFHKLYLPLILRTAQQSF